MAELMANGGADEWWVRLPDGRKFGPGAIGVIAQWAREGRVPSDAMIERGDGSGGVRAGEHPELKSLVLAPPTIAGQMPEPSSDGIGVIIPYKNGHALAGYYVGIFSVLVVIVVCGMGAAVMGMAGGGGGVRGGASVSSANIAGMVLIGLATAVLGFATPVVAVTLGIKGLKAAKVNPKIRGKVHAWVGIVGGCLGILIGVMLMVGVVAMAFAGSRP